MGGGRLGWSALWVLAEYAAVGRVCASTLVTAYSPPSVMFQALFRHVQPVRHTDGGKKPVMSGSQVALTTSSTEAANARGA